MRRRVLQWGWSAWGWSAWGRLQAGYYDRQTPIPHWTWHMLPGRYR